MDDKQNTATERQLLPFLSKELAMLWRIPFSSETEPSRVEIALRERIKELNCLYGISQLAERYSHSIEMLFKELVDLLPHSWQYPEITCTRIFFQGKTYLSKKFQMTNWRQSSRIYMYHQAVGEISIFYLEECPPSDEGPFLREERALLDAIAEQIGTIASRMSAEQELQETNRQLNLERKALQESNTALRAVMTQIEEEKQKIRCNINANVEKILIPILNALALQLPSIQKKYVELLHTNLTEITSPFVNQLSRSYQSMTPTEIAICNMIRNGLHTKEIAEIRGIAEATVNRHREKIRQKLKITNQDINLATYLQSTMLEDFDRQNYEN